MIFDERQAPSLASRDDSVCTVSALVQQARVALERAIALQWVSGEITGFKRAASGHCYFELKDASAQVACVLYRNRAALIGFELRDGAQVELRVRPSIYEPRGALQFTVEQARLAGVGRLYEAFLRLKAKLESEGLFAVESKRKLPKFPTRIGLITSTKAAALADMLRVFADRWPRAEIVVYPSSVQGANAPGELRAALQVANARAECDVLIIGRGGGSIEDLWAFNDEALVRAVAASVLPIVSAVGHETDFTLCDFAADLRAPTPSAAAALVVPERDALATALRQSAQRLRRSFDRQIDGVAQRLDRARDRLHASDRMLAPWRERLLALSARLDLSRDRAVAMRRSSLAALAGRYNRALATRVATANSASQLDRLGARLHAGVGARLRECQIRIDRLDQAVALLNPQHVLNRGYAAVYDANGRALSDATQTRTGAELAIQLARGAINASVIRVANETEPGR